MKSIWKWLRFALMIAILAWMAWQLRDWQKTVVTLAHVRLAPFLGSVAIYFVGLLVSCLKWRILLQAQGHTVSLGKLFHWYTAGTFAGTFLPTSVGGDIGRLYVAGREIGSHADALTSVMAERLSGLVALLAFSSVVIVLVPNWLQAPAFVPVVLLLFLAGSAALGMVVVRASPGWLPDSLQRAFRYLSTTVEQFRAQPGVIALALLLSLVFQALVSISVWFTCLAVTAHAPASTMLVAPLVGLAGLVPLTPGGLGIREGIMAYLLQHSGLSFEQAVAAALVSRISLFVLAFVGLPGFLMELRTHHKQPLATGEPDAASPFSTGS